MTPNEKAKELIDKMYFSRRYKDGEDYIAEQAWVHAKQCALIAVDEIIKEWSNEHGRMGKQNFWQQVKQEIEKL